jgi:hypothetical protein
MEAKYVIVDYAYPIIACGALNHSDLAKDKNVTSAGFCTIEMTKTGVLVDCFGGSSTLKMSHHQDDRIMIKVFLDGMMGKI